MCWPLLASAACPACPPDPPRTAAVWAPPPQPPHLLGATEGVPGQAAPREARGWQAAATSREAAQRRRQPSAGRGPAAVARQRLRRGGPKGWVSGRQACYPAVNALLAAAACTPELAVQQQAATPVEKHQTAHTAFPPFPHLTIVPQPLGVTDEGGEVTVQQRLLLRKSLHRRCRQGGQDGSTGRAWVCGDRAQLTVERGNSRCRMLLPAAAVVSTLYLHPTTHPTHPPPARPPARHRDPPCSFPSLRCSRCSCVSSSLSSLALLPLASLARRLSTLQRPSWAGSSGVRGGGDLLCSQARTSE